METEMDLINILDDITDDEFKNFKWLLKNERWNSIEPIKVNQLSKAERCDAVDLMVQKYEMTGTVQVMESVLKKMNRNDLGKRRANAQLMVALQSFEGLPVPGPANPTNASANPTNASAEERLKAVRGQFVSRVSEPILRKLLDQLLESGVINDDEMDLGGANNRADKARQVIDTVRGKGSSASSAMIAALCNIDRCLAEQLQLM